MPAYECPNCNGGFSDPEEKACPWCGQKMDQSYGDYPLDPDKLNMPLKDTDATVSSEIHSRASDMMRRDTT